MREAIEQWADENEVEDILLLDSQFDDALTGITRQFNHYIATYDAEKVIEIIMENGLTDVEAIEHFEFHYAQAWVGPTTPVFFFTPHLE